MSNIDPHSRKFIDQLKEYWFLIVFIGALVMGWNNITNSQAKAQEDIREIKAENKEQSAAIKLTSDTVIEIKANYLYIKNSLDKLTK